jgi:glutamate racemase
VSDARPIGVFDSGLGGLTVARSIMDALPQEELVYFADTARYPYGPRPLEQTRGFAVEIARHLMQRDAKLIVVACNTATAAALDDVIGAVPVPVIGVIEPAVRATFAATRNGKIGLIATEATVESEAYVQAIERLAPAGGIQVTAQACPRFVEFVERGDTTSPELHRVAEGYLALLRVAGIDTLILGCTHYPLLRGVIRHVVGDGVVLVSSADETAATVYRTLVETDALRDDPRSPRHAFESSGDTQRFAALYTLFMRPEFHETPPVAQGIGITELPWTS